jgi:Flp pilus assembly protein TadG
MTSEVARRGAGGQSLVEFAVIMPVIVLLVVGALDLGRGVFAYNSLANAARQANRTAMVDQNVTRVAAVAIASAPSLGLNSSNVSVCFKVSETLERDCSSPTTDNCPGATRVIGCLAIVTASLSYTPMTPVLGTLFGSIELSSTSVQPIEYVCPYDIHLTCP